MELIKFEYARSLKQNDDKAGMTLCNFKCIEWAIA